MLRQAHEGFGGNSHLEPAAVQDGYNLLEFSGRWQMLGGNNDYAKKLFADQFEPNGEIYVYRKSMKGAPVPVTAIERDRYLKNFGRAKGYLMKVFVLSLIVFSIFVAVFVPPAMSDTYITVGVSTGCAFFMVGWLWLWAAPARELRARAPVGEARSKEEKMRVFLTKTPYSQFAVFAFALLAIVWRNVDWKNWSVGKNLLWLLGGAVVAAAAMGHRVFQKWNYEKVQNLNR
jgi:protein-S-isoprenylcysteine O-methyltransferase Ste14